MYYRTETECRSCKKNYWVNKTGTCDFIEDITETQCESLSNYQCEMCARNFIKEEGVCVPAPADAPEGCEVFETRNNCLACGSEFFMDEITNQCLRRTNTASGFCECKSGYGIFTC